MIPLHLVNFQDLAVSEVMPNVFKILPVIRHG